MENHTNATATYKENSVEHLRFLSMVASPLYFVFILVPSLVLNGSVILIFAWKKDVRSPVSLLTVNQCFAGIFSNLLNGILFVTTPIAYDMGSCITGPLLLGSINWTHFGVNTINFAAISIATFASLMYGATFFTYAKATVFIAISWAYSGGWAALLTYTARNVKFVTCNAFGTDEADGRASGTVRGVIIAKFLLLDCICYILVFLFSFLSYRRFQRHILNPPDHLKRRMLLLPILMTSFLIIVNFTAKVFFATFVNSTGDTVSREQYAHNSPALYIESIGQLMLEYDAIIFSSLLIFFNTKLRRELKDMFSSRTKWMLQRRKNRRVLPSPSEAQRISQDDQVNC